MSCVGAPAELTEADYDRALEKLKIGFGVEREPGRKFALWCLMDALGVAPHPADAFAKARRFLSYLPSSVHELPTRTPSRSTAIPASSDCLVTSSSISISRFWARPSTMRSKSLASRTA